MIKFIRNRDFAFTNNACEETRGRRHAVDKMEDRVSQWEQSGEVRDLGYCKMFGKLFSDWLVSTHPFYVLEHTPHRQPVTQQTVNTML